MLSSLIIFFIIALTAVALGFGGISGFATGFAQALFFVFIVLFLVALIITITRGNRRLR